MSKKPKVKLIGKDGNAFSILARGKKSLKEAGKSEEIEKFITEAKSGNYEHLLQTMYKWFDVE